MPRRSHSFLARPGGLPVPVGCPVCLCLLIPPNFPREIFVGGKRVPAVGAGLRGPRPLPQGPPAMASRAASSAMASKLSVPLWRSPSCGPVRVCPEGPPASTPPRTLLPYHGCSRRNDMTQCLKVVPSYIIGY